MTSALIAPPATPPGNRLQQAGAAIWRALGFLGKLRAEPQPLEFANNCEALQPNLAKELRSYANRGKME